MKYVKGISLNNIFNNIENYSINYITKLFKLFIDMSTAWFIEGLFESRFFHADLHPGNIIITDPRDETIKFTLIDFGNCDSMTDNEINVFLNVLKQHNKIINILDYIEDKQRLMKSNWKYYYYVKEYLGYYFPYLLKNTTEYDIVNKYLVDIIKIIQKLGFKLSGKKIEKLTDKILEFYKTSPNKKSFGAFWERIIDSVDDLGNFGNSKIIVFVRGLVVLEKTSMFFKDHCDINNKLSVVDIIIENIYKKLNFINKIKIWYKLNQQKLD